MEQTPNTGCACGLSAEDCHPDCPHGSPLPCAISELRRFQRHHLLRQYGENGHVLPQNLKTSQALDAVLEALNPPSPSPSPIP